ncbi:DUF3892 domain-containing protein [Bacillus suaedaesalsae]|uniref:DUF3892 domain-containing protein n=1 Tax=Bacillus suaedaesalsae TaxID=2810349 RepID=A0ABS2DLH8_9BACI|nr:DUF3892 domain-containing protein [Bacillus suaedaesalsae]MBM6619328.1 DUF3892 domain-containing protein [Bacillus suaedaesalsae]
MMMSETVVAVQRNGDGDITMFKTSSGRVLTYQEALAEVSNHKLEGMNTFAGRDGEMYIRSNADGDPSNNLDQLPTF